LSIFAVKANAKCDDVRRRVRKQNPNRPYLAGCGGLAQFRERRATALNPAAHHINRQVRFSDIARRSSEISEELPKSNRIRFINLAGGAAVIRPLFDFPEATAWTRRRNGKHHCPSAERR
jgi:hypothetical protein